MAEANKAGQGRAVLLPNGKRRIDYIRDEFYNKGKTRSDIKNAINEMLKKEGKGAEIPYQIVFAATKDKETDPRIAAKAKADAVEKEKAKKAKDEAAAAKTK